MRPIKELTGQGRGEEIPTVLGELGRGPIRQVAPALITRDGITEDGYSIIGYSVADGSRENFRFEVSKTELLRAKAWLEQHPDIEMADKLRVQASLEFFMNLMNIGTTTSD